MGCYHEQKGPLSHVRDGEREEAHGQKENKINPEESQIWIDISESDSSWNSEVKTCPRLGSMSYL